MFFIAWQLIASRVDNQWSGRIEETVDQNLALSQAYSQELEEKLAALGHLIRQELLADQKFFRQDLEALQSLLGMWRGTYQLGGLEIFTRLAGSDIGFEIPGLGVFYPPNLTPDKKTGLGEWSDEQIIAAFTTGVRPDGRQLAPSMPWMSYGHISQEDAASLVAYLRTLPAVEHRVPGPFGAQEKPTAPYMSVVMPK